MSFKILVVLKITVDSGNVCVSSWEMFLRKLDSTEMLHLMPQILISIVTILKIPASKSLLEIIFVERGNELFNTSRLKIFVFFLNFLLFSEDLNKIMLVMSDNGYTQLDEYIQKLQYFKKKEIESPSEILQSCALMLYEGFEVYPIVLKKINRVLNTCPNIESSLNNQLVISYNVIISSVSFFKANSLLYALRKSCEPELRNLIGICLGQIGPIELGNSKTVSVERQILKNNYKTNSCVVDRVSVKYFFYIVL